MPFGMEKLEWRDYPMAKKFWWYVYSFWHNSRTWQTDTQTDRWRHRPHLHSIVRQKATRPRRVQNDASARPPNLIFGVVWPWPPVLKLIISWPPHGVFHAPHGPFVPICIKIASHVFKISCSQFWWQTNERTNERTSREHNASSYQSRLVEA